MLEKFKIHCNSIFPFLSKSKLLLACSGGLDSMVLAHILLECKMNFDLAHCNFKLRGLESDKDEAFVKAWGKAHGKKVYTRPFDLSKVTGSVQLKARQLRYEWFFALGDQYHYDWILTAHHLNDSVETFLINLSRGTGLDGLTGIPEIQNKVIRPLLPFSRTEIMEYAKEREIKWREDASNLDTKYLRNKVRHDIVPELEALHPTFLANFFKTQQYLQHSDQLLEDYKELLQQRLFEQGANAIHISLEKLTSLHPKAGYFFLLFREYGFTNSEDIEKLLGSTSGKALRSDTHRLIKDRTTLILAPIKQEERPCFFLDEGQDHLEYPVQLRLEEVLSLGSFSKNILYVDKEKLNYPLKIRKWEIGDYFYPLGMEGRKKLSKFFKDEKFDTIAKEEQWLLCSGNEVVWVMGKRPDKRFKVTGDTKEILKITVL